MAAPQRFKERSSLHGLNKVWVTDITYIPTKEGWLYVAAEMDRFSRKILGWAAADHLRTSLPLDALHKALQSRPKPPAELLHHSDRGCQYSSVEFRQKLDEYGIAQSMATATKTPPPNPLGPPSKPNASAVLFQVPVHRQNRCFLTTSKPFTTRCSATVPWVISHLWT